MTRLITIFANTTALMLAMALSGNGCLNQVDRLTDCQDICSRYADCYDSTYDVGDCRSSCTRAAKDDPDFDQLVDQCENCFDDRSCTSAEFGCASDCSTIVP